MISNCSSTLYIHIYRTSTTSANLIALVPSCHSQASPWFVVRSHPSCTSNFQHSMLHEFHSVYLGPSLSKFMCKIAQNQHQIPCPSANLPASFANLWQISSGFVALHRWDETCCDSLPPCWWWPQDGFMSPNRPSSNPSPYIFSDELK